MWNQASNSAASGAGSSIGGSHSNMAHTPGSFAQHARPANIVNSPSAHRRAGGVGPAQHASPSGNAAFPRPFANVAFPGTVSAPRSAAPPNSASAAAQRSLQHLPLLTAQTPTSLAKLSFPPNTTVFWYHLQRNRSETASDESKDSAVPAAASSTGPSDDVSTAWDSGIQDVLASISKARARSHDTDGSQDSASAQLPWLLRDPLVFTSSTSSSSQGVSAVTSDGSAADLWLFLVSPHDVESGSKVSSTSGTDSTASTVTQPSNAETAVTETASRDAAQKGTANLVSLPIDSHLAQQLPSHLAKALARLSLLANVSSGSYALARASPASVDAKGKQPSLTSKQRQANKRLLASIKARAVESIACSTPASEQSREGKTFTRSRLRLGDHIVFLPPRRDDAKSSALTGVAWPSAAGKPSTLPDGADHYSLISKLEVSLSRTSLLVRTISRRLAALPLTSTRHSYTGASILPSSSRASLLLAPLGCQADLVGVVPTSSIASDHLSELHALFATLDNGREGVQTDGETLFSSGLAICALPPSTLGSTAETLSRPQQAQPQDASLDGFAQGDNADQSMDLSALSTIHQHESTDSMHQKLQGRQFLWPVPWCLVMQDRRGASAQNDLLNMRSQPMTPLKELVSYTLKVLSDANETAFAQSTAPYTPGEPDDASMSRHRVDRLPSTRPDITPGSISFPDFDFAIPAAGSATPSQSLPGAGQSVPGTSPAKRNAAGTEAGQGAASTEAFGDDLNWMQFLPPTSEAPVTAPASMAAPAPALHVESAGLTHSEAGPGPMVSALASSSGGAKEKDAAWAFSTDSASDPTKPSVTAASTEPPSLLPPPPGQVLSQGSTPFQGQDATPLGFGAQPAPTKRKAGETDIFGNLGLLTEDDFSFFDESAFGLESESALSGPSVGLQHPLERPMSASSNGASFGQPLAIGPHAGPAVSTGAISQPATSTAAAMDDVAMDDIEQNSLDALFSAIPGLQDVMATSEPSQTHAQHAPVTSLPTTTSAAADTQAVQSRNTHSGAQDIPAIATSSAHPFHPGLSSFTPRDASGATPFGDPASLPGFTPSSLTESSPAFGNTTYKTPRTPFSPVEDYRDGATIVDLQNVNRMGESAQSFRERNAVSAAPDAAGHASIADHKGESHLKEDDLRLADASTAAAAAANAAMDSDAASRKRPAIVPSAFLPLTQPEARKPLQKLSAGARANLGRKYDLLGKFASKPKTLAAVPSVTTGAMAGVTEQPHSKEAKKAPGPTERASAPEPGRLRQAPNASQFGLGATRPSPSKTPSRRGQALLQLRRDRNSKASSGAALISHRRASSQRMNDNAATPRSSDDIVMSGAMSASDSDSSSSGDEDSDDALSETEGTTVTLSSEEQVTLKGFSREIVTAFLRGTSDLSSDLSRGSDQTVGDAVTSKSSITLPLALQRGISASVTSSPGSTFRPTLRRWMLKRTAEWLVQNPQFRAMYGATSRSTVSPDMAIGEKVEVLEAIASALSIQSASPPIKPSAETDVAGRESAEALPTLQRLMKPSKPSTANQADGGEIAQVLEPTKIAVGCEGSVVETLPSALTLWDKSKLSAVSGQKHVTAKVLLTHASPAWHDEIVAWLERLRIAFEAHGLGTHTGGAASILAVADGSESAALSSYLDRLWKDGETWLDTLGSIASRVQLDLLQGKHVVVYTLQPPNSPTCSATGFHGLLRLEADLRAMLSEQVGVLSEQLLVRPVDPAMMTEGGSLGFSQQAHFLRKLAFSVYDQLPRLVRRQPAKVLHGREPGPISAVVQFPAFSLSIKNDTKRQDSATRTGRTHFSLSWPDEPATALDEHVLLHVSYRICQPKPREHSPHTAHDTLFDATQLFGLSQLDSGAESTAVTPEALVMVSAIDGRGGSSSVDVLAAKNGDSSVEACIERVWRFALAEASRARVRWRLAISSAGVVTLREVRAWQRLVGAYLSATEAKERVMGSVVLLSVRPDESGSILTERGVRTKPNAEWTAAAAGAKEGVVLLDAADFSQMLTFAEPLPMAWTLPFDGSLGSGAEEEEEMVMPLLSSVLVHKSRRDLLCNGSARTDASHVLAVDMLQYWPPAPQPQDSDGVGEEESEAMDAIVRSLHSLRLISEERHQLPWPYAAQPWSVASVNTLTAALGDVVLGD